MFAGAIAWLTGKIAGPVFAVTSAALLILCGVLWIEAHGWPLIGGGLDGQIKTLKGDNAALMDRIAGLNLDLDREKTNSAQFRSASETCNASVTAAKEESDRRLADAEASLKGLRASLAASERRAGAILAAKPAAGETACQAAERYLRDTIQ